MIKTLSIGDVHGRLNWSIITHESFFEYRNWEIAVENGADPVADLWAELPFMKYDKIIFIGDYVDSFTTSDITIKHNLLKIIQFKKLLGDKVVLLLGNHDIQYIVSNQICSGYRPQMRPDLFKIFNDNLELFTVAYQINNKDKSYLWTHAGVTSGWLKELDKILYNPNFRFYDIVKEKNFKSIADKLNFAWDVRLDILFSVDRHSGGISTWAGPLWVRPHILNDHYLKDAIQIVGHTAQAEIWSVMIDDNTEHHFIDVTEFCDNGLELEIEQ